MIERFAFRSSSIEKIIIPSHITKICEETFSYCENLECIEFLENSEIQIIEDNAFRQSAIEGLILPSSLEKLNVNWCSGTSRLYIIDVKPNNCYFVFHDDFLILGKST